MSNDAQAWTLDADQCWIFQIGKARVWIQARPPYCDRGHWIAHVEGIPTIDGADAFPRYFMDFERARLEMADWLIWRLQREKRI